MSFQPGQRVGDYEIVGTLGAGGMGRVYKVRHVISERVEAMKVLLPNLESEPGLAERFLREIKVQASLSHPNIAGLHTAVRAENQLLMLMEFVEGVTLEQMVSQGPVPLPQALDAFCQVLSALGYAHSRGVIHRDLKPANMMLTPQRVMKLMDFGIARPSADQKLTQSGVTVGSLPYMSPEQIKGVEPDARADLYSLGIALYEVVTGQRPFKGDSEFSLMAAHLQQDPEPPIRIDPTLPPDLNALILTSIAKDPARRFQTADAMRNALLRVLDQVKKGPQRVVDAGTRTMAQPAMVAPAPSPAPVPQPVPAVSLPPTAPIPVAPTALMQPPVAAAPPHSTSRRGLYMALGSIATLAVLVVAAMQIPKWIHTSAATPSPASTTPQSVAQPPAANVSPPVTQPSPAEQPTAAKAAAERVEPRATTSSAEAKPPAVRTKSSRDASQAPPQRPSGLPGYQAPTQAQPQTQPQSEPRTQPPVPAAAAPAEPSLAEARAAREELMNMAARAGAVRDSISRLEQRQAAMGLGLNPDVKAGMTRLTFFLTEARQDLGRGDVAGAKDSMAKADVVLERLENFIGGRR